MYYQEMVEKIRRADPTALEPELLSALNEASDTFCELTRILSGEWTFETNGNMFFDIDDRCSSIREATLSGQIMYEFGGNLEMIELQV